MLQIEKNASLKKLNTFGLDVKARELAIVNSKEDLPEVFSLFSGRAKNTFFLGGGSNVLFTKDFDGLVVAFYHKDIELIRETKKDVLLRVSSGMPWDEFVQYCMQNKFYGCENLTAIPGSVGGAAIQNIGAYGVEVKDLIEEVEFYDPKENRISSIKKAECHYGYRDSIFKHSLKGVMILSVNFRLSKNANLKLDYGNIRAELQKRSIEKPGPEDVSKIVRSIRASKLPDPEEYGNAGSFFKNPVVSKEQLEKLLANYPDIVFYPAPGNQVKIAAGWLIDRLGWKGKEYGGAAVHEKQALVIINKNNARPGDIIQLSKLIREDVMKHFDIELETEVVFV